MAAVQESDQPDSTTTIQDNPDEYRGLDPESYTAQRLVSVFALRISRGF